MIVSENKDLKFNFSKKHSKSNCMFMIRKNWKIGDQVLRVVAILDKLKIFNFAWHSNVSKVFFFFLNI